MVWLLLAALVQTPARSPRDSYEHRFVAPAGEAIAVINAGCARCDWGSSGREAVLLELSVDGKYSQHLALMRGEGVSEYRVLLGPVSAGEHRLSLSRDTRRSAAAAGAVTYGNVAVELFADGSPEHEWLARAPILYARPGTVERFSDFPMLTYVERDVRGENGSGYRFQYTAIFTNEDGGTPTDRLMATWGRTTDIEFIYGLKQSGDGRAFVEEIQSAGHRWINFEGSREHTHPLLWVATDNNMVADHGPPDSIRFAPAPELVTLTRTSREAVMDAHPWTYAVTTAEMRREGRIDPAARPGSGSIVDPRQYVTIEACGETQDATFAFDIAVRSTSSAVVWYPTDTDSRFRLARNGCFRAGAPVPGKVSVADVVGLRIRAHPHPPTESSSSSQRSAGVRVLAVTRIFMLNDSFTPLVGPQSWTGSLQVPATGEPVEIPIGRH